MNVNISFGFYVSCYCNQGYIEILNKKKINNLLKIGNPIFFNVHDYVDEKEKFIIPFFMTNKMDDVYQLKKWNCFCYIYVNKITKMCIVFYPSVIGLYTRSYSSSNLYQNFIDKLYLKLKVEKYFDGIFNSNFNYSMKLYDANDITLLQQTFDLNLEPFNSINSLIDHKKMDMILTIEDFRELEYMFFSIYHMEYKARVSDEKTGIIYELNQKLEQNKLEMKSLLDEKQKLYEQLNENTKYVQNELNDFLLEVRKKLNDVELPIYEKKIVPEFNQTHCSICTDLLSNRECIFVESSKVNPWEYSDKKESIVNYIEAQDKFECGHLFHKDCIQFWLQTRKPESIYITEENQIVHCDDDYTYKTCPLCKGYIIRMIKWKPSIK